MHNNTTPRSLRRIETDSRILEAALTIFGEKGYTRSSLAEIGKLAGVTGGLLTQRFGTKENLLKEATTLCIQQLGSTALDSTDILNIFLAPLRLYNSDEKTYKKISAFLKIVISSHDVPESLKDSMKMCYLKSKLHKYLSTHPEECSSSHLDSYGLIESYTLAAFNYIDNCIKYGHPIPEEKHFPGLIGYRNKNIEREYLKWNSMIRAFSASFYGLFYIYIPENRFEIIKQPDFLTETTLDVLDAQKVFHEILPSRVHPQYVEKMSDFTNIETASERLGEKESLSVDYIGSNRAWARVSLIPVMRDAEGKVTELLLGITELSSEKDYMKILNLQESFSI